MKSYLKFLSRNKLYASIQALGLAVSLAFVILIGSYVVQQYQVAHESPDWKRTFVLGNDDFMGLTYWDKEELETNIPEVDAVTHLSVLEQPIIRNGDEVVLSFGMEADADFFRVFPQYKLIEGNIEDFVGESDVLISKSLAERLSKDGKNLVGSVLNLDETDRTIKGVYADFDRTFFLPFEVITNISGSEQAGASKEFGSIGNYTTWFRIREGASPDDVQLKVKSLLHKNYDSPWGADKVESWRAFRMDEAFFSQTHSNGLFRCGNVQMLRLLTVVAFLLLLSAIFNYVNLSLALTGKRAKEMATRRLIGASKTNILCRYIGESVAFTAVCFAVALLLADLLVPMVNSLVSNDEDLLLGNGGTGVRISFMMTPQYIIAYIASVLVLGVVNGLFPALVASGSQPIDVVKGTLRRRNKMVLSKAFIAIQNVLSVFLIAMALLMEIQMHYMLSRPTHTATENLYYIEYSAQNYDQMKLFKDKVEQLPFVTKVGVGRGIPGHINMQMGIRVDEEHNVDMPIILCDPTYFQLLGFEVDEDFGHPLVHSLWMSRSAFRAAGVSDTSTVFPRRIKINGAQPEFIGGVVHDFPTTAAKQANYGPTGAILVTKTEELIWANCLLIGTTGEDESYSEAILQAYRDYRLQAFGVEEPVWTYGFLKEISKKQLAPLLKTTRFVELFALIAMLISLLGLLAMSTYFAEENTRQIAIRKVFGAEMQGEVWRNVQQYMLLVAVACCIGIPLAVVAAGRYMQQFPYRVENYGWVFIVAVLVVLAFSLLAVLSQVLKAARTNPATELKKE